MTFILEYDILYVKQALQYKQEVFTIKNKIAQLRGERGLTQINIAEDLGVSRQTIISLERGKYNPSIQLAHKIAVFFGKAIEEVFIFEEEDI